MFSQREENPSTTPRVSMGISEYWAWLLLGLLVSHFLPKAPAPDHLGYKWEPSYPIAGIVAAVIATLLVELARRKRARSDAKNPVKPYPYAPLTIGSLFRAVLALSIIFALVTQSNAPQWAKPFWMLFASLAVIGYYICGQLVRWLSPTQLPK